MLVWKKCEDNRGYKWGMSGAAARTGNLKKQDV